MYRKILIIVSGGPASQAAVSEGVGMAKVHGAEAVFFSVLPRHVVPLGDMPALGMPAHDEFLADTRKIIEHRLAEASQAAQDAGARSTIAVYTGVDNAECIVKAATKWACDLIVVASTGSNAVMRLLGGSLIPGLITRSTVPVLVCRQAGTHEESEAAVDESPPSARPDPGPDSAVQTRVAT